MRNRKEKESRLDEKSLWPLGVICVDGNIILGSGQDVERSIRMICEHNEKIKGYDPDRLENVSTGVLNVADDYSEWEHHRDVLYIHAGLNDGPEDWEAPWGEHNSPRAYLNAIAALDFLVDGRDTVYVCCHGGASRSCFVVCLYLSWVYGADFHKTVDAVKRRYERMNIHPKHIDRLPHLQQMLGDMPGSRCSLYWRDIGMLAMS